ncbi:MAG: c-type cytochrome [Nitrospinae bacterium]|nr:c-type cytochrome [Nitrospinota bacterium]
MGFAKVAAIAATTVLLGGVAHAESGEDILKKDCSGCHALSKPASFTVERVVNRKGPDLYYAGDKFNKPWLVKWLQNPGRIRPAGEFYFNHVKATSEVDTVDEKSIPSHPGMGNAEAVAVADALSALSEPGLVEKGGFLNEEVNMTLAGMFFGKLRGCSACHMGKPGAGGKSGPELYTAADRLKPDYILAYIKDPQKIDRYVWMPKQEMSPADTQKLAGYILRLSAGEAK